MKYPFKRTQSQPMRHVDVAGKRAPVFSYYNNRPVAAQQNINSAPQSAVRRRSLSRTSKYWLRRFGMVLVGAAIIASLIPLLGVSTDAKVEPMDPTRMNFLHPLSTYQQSAQQILAGSLLNRTKLTLNANAISEALQQKYPALSVVSVTLPLIGNRPVIYILPAKPIAFYSTNHGSYLIDERGKVLSQVPSGLTAETYQLVALRDESNTPVRIGQQVVATSTANFMQQILFQLQSKHLNVTSFVLPTNKSELDMYVAGYSYFVKFNLADNTAGQQIGTYLAVKHSLEQQGITPSAYIDVRIAGRAYYR